MNKERTAGLIFFGDISDEEIRSIPEDFHGDIIVTGDINCKGECRIPGSLWIEGDLKAIYLKVEGDMFVNAYSKIKTTEYGIDISGDAVLGEGCFIDSMSKINVGGDLELKEGEGKIDATGINVYGTFEFFGEIFLNACSIFAGKLKFFGELNDCQEIITGW